LVARDPICRFGKHLFNASSLNASEQGIQARTSLNRPGIVGGSNS